MALVKLTIHAAQVGAWLTVMKSRKEHGGWEGWVGENCLFDIRTAQRYMKLYRKLIALPKTTLVSFLNMPVNTAYRELSVVKTPTELVPVETPPLPEGVYDVIVIDPPWQIAKQRRAHASMGTAAYYLYFVYFLYRQITLFLPRKNSYPLYPPSLGVVKNFLTLCYVLWYPISEVIFNETTSEKKRFSATACDDT